MEQKIIEKRIVDSKRHTIGYVVDGKRMTKGKVVQLARRGKVKGVYPRHGVFGWYVAAKPSADSQLIGIQVIVEKK